LVFGGLTFIHGFSGVLTILWYHQTFLPSDEFEKKQELIIASMQIKNSEMGDNPVGKFLAFYKNTNIIKTAIKLILNIELMY
jgi:hypothetical protein